MHRRQFLGMIAGSLLLPATATRAQAPEATPDATPEHSGGPRPIVLGDGIELIDYRIYPSSDVRRIIGEIWNTRDDIIDAPSVSMTFPGVEELGGFAYASPFMPVLRPGESTMIFGVIPDEIESEEQLAAGEFGLCGPVGPGEYAERYRDLQLDVTRDVANLTDESANVQGEIVNNGPSRAAFTCVRGLVRDHNGRYAGTTYNVNTGHLLPGGSRTYSLWTAGVLADPFALLVPGREYSVDVIPGLVGPLTAPGCSAGYPWD